MALRTAQGEPHDARDSLPGAAGGVKAVQIVVQIGAREQRVGILNHDRAIGGDAGSHHEVASRGRSVEGHGERKQHGLALCQKVGMAAEMLATNPHPRRR